MKYVGVEPWPDTAGGVSEFVLPEVSLVEVGSAPKNPVEFGEMQASTSFATPYIAAYVDVGATPNS